MHDIRIYLKAGIALAAMGTVSFLVFGSITGLGNKPRPPVAEKQLAGGGPDYIHGRDPVSPLDGPVTAAPAAFGASPFAASYRISEQVGREQIGRSYDNGLDVDGEIRHLYIDGVWKAPSFTRASRQLAPQPWQPAAIAFDPAAARCPADLPGIAAVGSLRFGAVPRPPAGLASIVQPGGRIVGCQHLGEVLPLSHPAPLVTEAVLTGEIVHRGRPALLLEISAKGPGWDGVERYEGYALLDRATGWLVFSTVEGRFADPAAHGGYKATIRETVRVDLP